MKLRRGTTSEQALEDLEERRTQLGGKLERQEAELETARRQVREARELEAAALLDEPDPSKARNSRVDAEGRLAERTSNLDVLRRSIELLDGRVEAKRGEIRAEQLAEARAALQRGLAGPTAASKAIAAGLKQADEARRMLLEERENVSALRAKVVELGGDRYEHEEDEAERPDTRELVEFLASDRPRRPVSKHELWKRQQEIEAEAAPRRERAHWLEQARGLAGLSWGPEETERKVERFFADVPDHLRDAAREAYAAERAKVEANRGRVIMARV